MKYKKGTELIDSDGEVVLIRDTDLDYHTRKGDYYLLVTHGVRHSIGSLFWVNQSVVESWFRELTPQEKVLYGKT